MDLHSIAADVLAHLANTVENSSTVEGLAAETGATREEIGAACSMLCDWGVLDGAPEERVSLPPAAQPHLSDLVLVLENTPAVAHVLNALLESEGYRVLHASALQTGLDVLRLVRPGLIIADSFSASASEVFDRLKPLREAAAPARVLLFTAYRDVQERDVRAAGFAGLIPKPFDIDELLARVAEETGAPRPR